MRYALIKDEEVKNVIVCDESFISNIEHMWDCCVRVDNLGVAAKWARNDIETEESPPDEEAHLWQYDPGVEEPGVGWGYSNGTFTKPK